MLELLQDVFPWLVGFYLLDAVASVPQGQALYAAGLRTFRRLGPGLHLPGLLPTSRLLAALDAPPLWRGRSLWLRAGSRRYAPLVFRPDDLEEVPLAAGVEAAGDRVRLGPRTLLRGPTPGHAQALVAALREAGSGIGEGGRAAGDVPALRRVLAAEAVLTAVLQLLCALLFLLLFGALPAIAYGGPATHQLLGPLLAALGAVHLAILAAGAGLLRRAGRSWAAAAGVLLPLALFPPYAAHALVHLRRDLLAGWDPAVAAAALLPRGALVSLARRETVRLSASRAAASGPLADAWADREAAWSAALEQAGVTRADLGASPPAAADAAAYCPACSAQYRDGFSTCADCGLPLQPFARGAAAG